MSKSLARVRAALEAAGVDAEIREELEDRGIQDEVKRRRMERATGRRGEYRSINN